MLFLTSLFEVPGLGPGLAHPPTNNEVLPCLSDLRECHDHSGARRRPPTHGQPPEPPAHQGPGPTLTAVKAPGPPAVLGLQERGQMEPWDKAA